MIRLAPATATVTLDLKNAPEFATELGHLSNAAAALEWNLFNLFQMLSDGPHNISRVTFYGISNFRTKIEVTKALALLVAGTTPAAKKVSDALDKAYKRYKSRSRFVHSPLCQVVQEADQKSFVIRFDVDATAEHGILEEINLHDLQETTRLLNESRDEIHAQMENLRPLIRGKLERLREEPGPSLQFAKKGAPRQKPRSKRS